MGQLLPALHGEHGDRPDAVEVAGERTGWSTLAARAERAAAAIHGASAVAVAARPRSTRWSRWWPRWPRACPWCRCPSTQGPTSGRTC